MSDRQLASACTTAFSTRLHGNKPGVTSDVKTRVLTEPHHSADSCLISRDKATVRYNRSTIAYRKATAPTLSLKP